MRQGPPRGPESRFPLTEPPIATELIVLSVFALPDSLAAKLDPALVAADEAHFASIARTIDDTVADLEGRLDAERRKPGESGEEALARDQEIHRLSARLRTLRRFSLSACLGRFVTLSGETTYVGRLGLTDRLGERLLVDWRSPAAEPFFAATHAHPAGLASRRRYRWSGGVITDYWEEVYDGSDLSEHAALDDSSAFIASLGASRSARMRDVLGTIQADQDAIIRAGSRGALVVDGGPGTGKTVVALHRTAYLLYADPRLGQQRRDARGSVLFVGPHRPYLAYVADVLPSLGEEGVLACTLRDLVPEGTAEPAPESERVARLKDDARMVDAIEPAVALYEEPPSTGMEAETAWGQVWVSTADWAEAFGAVEAGTPHNDARDVIAEALGEIVADKLRDALDDPEADTAPEVDVERVRRGLRGSPVMAALRAAWPMLEASELVADLWAVPAYLRRCAPWLSEEEVQLLRRAEGSPWTRTDLPLLDAARLRLGDPEAAATRHRAAAIAEAEREEREAVVTHLIASDDSDLQVMSMLRGDDLRAALVDEDGAPAVARDRLAGPFGHIVVDEAQELSDAEWQMLTRRCPSGSYTIVGDRAQARHGFTETWARRLAGVGIGAIEQRSLTINYRTPIEIMEAAEPVIRAALPDANVPTSVRSGEPVRYADLAALDAVLDEWRSEGDDGVACVIAAPQHLDHAERTLAGRARVLTPELAKGLEFDLVVLFDPEAYGTGLTGAVDRYVAMTRATRRLVVLGP